MYKIFLRRTLQLKAPFKVVADVNHDWTHFPHLHRKTIKSHRLLYRNGQRQIFLYKARRLYPLPFCDDYVVLREDTPNGGYRNVYVNVKSGAIHALDAKLESQGDWTVVTADHFFSLPSYWRFLPKIFLRLFVWVFKRRMNRIVDEDNEWIYGLMKTENVSTEDACAPVVPPTYDILDEFFKKEPWELADVRLEDRLSESFDGKGRLRLKEKS